MFSSVLIEICLGLLCFAGAAFLLHPPDAITKGQILAVTSKVVGTAAVPGAERTTRTEITLDSEYAAGGEPVTVSELGLTRLVSGRAMLLTGSESETVEVGFARFEVVSETEAKIRVYNYKTQKEIATGKNLEKVKVEVIASGK